MPSDLKSLCLTSKALHDLATPRLFNRVHVQIWHEKYIQRFFRSVTAGADSNLGNTRILVIEDEPPPREPISIITSPLELEICDGPPTPAEEKDSTIASIIPIFPRDTLRAFRFVLYLPYLSL